MSRLTLPILLALSFVLAPFTAASHARSRITTSAEIVSSELQTELLQEAADASFLAALAADFELWTVIIAPEKPTMEAESCAPVVGFFVWGLMPRPPPLDAKTRARAFDLEDDVYAELQAFLTQNPPLGYGLFRADLTTGIPELMFWDPNGLERGMLPSSHIQSNNLMADMGVISAEDASRINGIIEKHKEDPIYTILFYAGAGEILVVSALTFGSGIVIAGMSVGATIDSTYQIDQSLKAFDQGQIRFYDPLQAADSMVIGGALAGPTMLLPRPLLYALQAGVGGHGVYQITQENYVSGTTEIIMSLAPFASREYRGQLFKDLQFEIPPLEIPASLVEPVQGPWAINPTSGINTTADVSALTAEEIAFLESWRLGAPNSGAYPTKVANGRTYELRPSNGGNGPNRWHRAGQFLEGTAGPARAFHHTVDEAVVPIMRTGLRPGSYATPTSNLSPLQAHIELALNPAGGARNAVLQVDLAGLRAAGYEIPPVTRVTSAYGMPGGGWEMRFPYEIPSEFLKVVKP